MENNSKKNKDGVNTIVENDKETIGFNLNSSKIIETESFLDDWDMPLNNLSWATEEDDFEEDGLEEDGLEEDGLEEDGLEEDSLEEDGLEEDSLEEDKNFKNKLLISGAELTKAAVNNKGATFLAEVDLLGLAQDENKASVDEFKEINIVTSKTDKKEENSSDVDAFKQIQENINVVDLEDAKSEYEEKVISENSDLSSSSLEGAEIDIVSTPATDESALDNFAEQAQEETIEETDDSIADKVELDLEGMNWDDLGDDDSINIADEEELVAEKKEESEQEEEGKEESEEILTAKDEIAKVSKKKMLLILIPIIVIVLGLFFAAFKLFFNKNKLENNKQTTTEISWPPIRDAQSVEDVAGKFFLILSDEYREILVSADLTVYYHKYRWYLDIQDQEIFCRDAIFRLLENQSPSIVDDQSAQEKLKADIKSFLNQQLGVDGVEFVQLTFGEVK